MEEKILHKISKKELQLLKFMREKYRFGKIEVAVHAGQPVKISMQTPPDVILDGNT